MKTQITTISIISYVLLVLLLTACQKSNFEDHVGTSICATSNFRYIDEPTISNASINLSTQVQLLSATFNEEVPWTVLIKGETSKAFKKYTGYGKSIDITWKGNPDTLVFFQTEQCTVEFQVACKNPVIKTFVIVGLNNFSYLDYLIFDGDGGGLTPISYGPYQTSGIVAGNSPQEGNCFCMEGSSPFPTWYFGAVEFSVVSPAALNEDPSTVYLNCFFNTEGSTTIIPIITLYEGNKIKREKKVFTSGTGWHYVSYKLSEFNILNPKNINRVTFTPSPYPVPTSSGKMCFDFVTFTNDAPFFSIPQNKR